MPYMLDLYLTRLYVNVYAEKVQAPSEIFCSTEKGACQTIKQSLNIDKGTQDSAES